MKVKITPPALAKKWGVGTPKIHGYIRRGDLPAINIAEPHCTRPRYLIDIADVAALEKKLRVIPDGGESTTQKLRRKTRGNVIEFF